MPERPPVSTRRQVPDDMFGGRLKGSYLLDLEVVGVEDVAPHMRLITMASSDLVGFEHTPGQDLLFEFPDGDLTLRRRYTIRRLDPAAGMADFEIEIHDGNGPATRWAAKAEVGEHLEAIGPRGGITLRPTAMSHLFVVDDSAMPAAFVMLEVFLVSPNRPGLTAFFAGVASFSVAVRFVLVSGQLRPVLRRHRRFACSSLRVHTPQRQ